MNDSTNELLPAAVEDQKTAIALQPQWYELLAPNSKTASVWDESCHFNNLRHSQGSTEDEVQAQSVKMRKQIEHLWQSGERPDVFPWLAETVPQFTRPACKETGAWHDPKFIHQTPVIPNKEAYAFAQNESGRRTVLDAMIQSEMNRTGLPFMRLAGSVPKDATAETIHRWAEATRLPMAELFRTQNADYSGLTGSLAPEQRSLWETDLIYTPSQEMMENALRSIRKEVIEQSHGTERMVFEELRGTPEWQHTTPSVLDQVITSTRWSLENNLMTPDVAFPILREAYALLYISMQMDNRQIGHHQIREARALREDFASLLTGGSYTQESGSIGFNGTLDYLDAAMMLSSSMDIPELAGIDPTTATEMGTEWEAVFPSISSPAQFPNEAYAMFLITVMRIPPAQKEQYHDLIDKARLLMHGKIVDLPKFHIQPQLTIQSNTVHTDIANSARQQVLQCPHGLNLVCCDHNDYEMMRDTRMQPLYATDAIGKKFVDYRTGKWFQVGQNHAVAAMQPQAADKAEGILLRKIAPAELLLKRVEGSRDRLLAHIFSREAQHMIERTRDVDEGAGSVADTVQMSALLERITGISAGFDKDLVTGINRMTQIVRESPTIAPGDMDRLRQSLSEGDKTGTDDLQALTLKAFCATGIVPKDLWINFQIESYSAMIRLTAIEILEQLERKERERMKSLLGEDDEQQSSFTRMIALAKSLETMSQEGVADTDASYREVLQEFTTRLAQIFTNNSNYSLRFETMWDSLSGYHHEKNSGRNIWAQCNSSQEVILSCLQALAPSVFATNAGTYGKETAISLQDWMATISEQPNPGETSHNLTYIPLSDGVQFIDGTAGRNAGVSQFVPKENIENLPESEYMRLGAKVRVEIREWLSWKREQTVTPLRGGSALVSSLASRLRSIPLMLAADPDNPLNLRHVIYDKFTSRDVKIDALERLLLIEPRFALFCSEPALEYPDEQAFLLEAMSLAASESNWWIVTYLSNLARQASFFPEDFRTSADNIHETAITFLTITDKRDFDEHHEKWKHLLPTETEKHVREERQKRESRLKGAKVEKGWLNSMHDLTRKIGQNLGTMRRNQIWSKINLLTNPPPDDDPAAEFGKRSRKDVWALLQKGKNTGSSYRLYDGRNTLVPSEVITQEQATLTLASLVSDTNGLLPADEQARKLRLVRSLVIQGYAEFVHGATKNASDREQVPLLLQTELTGMLEQLESHARLVGVAPQALLVFREPITNTHILPPNIAG